MAVRDTAEENKNVNIGGSAGNAAFNNQQAVKPVPVTMHMSEEQAMIYHKLNEIQARQAAHQHPVMPDPSCYSTPYQKFGSEYQHRINQPLPNYEGVQTIMPYNANLHNYNHGMTQMYHPNSQQAMAQFQQVGQQPHQVFIDHNNPRPDCGMYSPYEMTPQMQRDIRAFIDRSKIRLNTVEVKEPERTFNTGLTPGVVNQMDTERNKRILAQRRPNHADQFKLSNFNKFVRNKQYTPTTIKEDDILIHIDNACEVIDNMRKDSIRDNIYNVHKYQSNGELLSQATLLNQCGVANPAIKTYIYQTESGGEGYYWMDANGVVMPCAKNHMFTTNMKVELAATYGLKEEDIEGVFIVKDYNVSILSKKNVTLSDYVKGRISGYYNKLNDMRTNNQTRTINNALMHEFSNKQWYVHQNASLDDTINFNLPNISTLDNHVRIVRFIPYDKIHNSRSVYVPSTGLVVGDDSLVCGTDHPEWKYILPDQTDDYKDLGDDTFNFKIRIVDNSTNKQNYITIGNKYFPIRSRRSSWEQDGVYVTVNNKDETLNQSFVYPLDKAYELGITHTEEDAQFLCFATNKTKLLDVEAELQMTKNKLAKVELEKQMLETKREVLRTDREVEKFKSENKVHNAMIDQAGKELDFHRDTNRKILDMQLDVAKHNLDMRKELAKFNFTIAEFSLRLEEKQRAMEIVRRELEYKGYKTNSETVLTAVGMLGKFAKIVGL